MNTMARVALCWVAALAVSAAAEEKFHVIPMNVDPPVVVDGDLADWAVVPCALIMKNREQVTFGPTFWKGPEDLSAVVRLAWRQEGLYVAAEVTDDAVVQTATGGDFWRGDHVSVLMDMTPGAEPARDMIGAGQFHLGLSPGISDAAERKGEAYVWRPLAGPPAGARVVSRKTATGYVIEAFVPWSGLGVKAPVMNQDANFEVFVSDTDSLPPKQESLITVDTRPWAMSRARLNPVVFGDGNGKGAPPTRTMALLGKGEAAEGKTLQVKFVAPVIPAGKEPYVFFTARIDRPKVAGYRSRSLEVLVNGKRVEGRRLSNRPPASYTMSGKEATFVAPDGFITMPYAPSAKAFDENPHYALVGQVKGCEFEFNIAGLLTEGENTLSFHNISELDARYPMVAVIEGVELRLKSPLAPPPPPKPAPAGDLPVYEPAASKTVVYGDLKTQGAKLSFSVAGETYNVSSEFSAPDGKWREGASAFYSHKRQVVDHGEWIEVRDTFKNLTGENLPLLSRHKMVPASKPEAFWLAGNKMPGRVGKSGSPSNPSAFLTTARSGAGLVASDDVFRVHSFQAAEDDGVRLGDGELVLRPGVEYTAEWMIVPVAAPDYWAFVNAARRAMDANFTLKYQFAFISHRKPLNEWPDDRLKQYIEFKGADIVCQGIVLGKYKGQYPHGVAFSLMSDKYDFYTVFMDRLKRMFPDGRVKHSIYYHCFLDVIEENEQKFKDCWTVDWAGNHLTYGGKASLMLYVPTMDNAWGKATAEGIDIRLDKIGTQCIYWDEFDCSSASYTYNCWDGWSGDVDPKTLKIKRLKASVHLAALDWLVFQAKRIMARVPLIVNGPPQSRTVARLKIQNFVETGSISNCSRTILHSPVALGDHLTEKTEVDAYNVMRKALSHGCLYNWYSDLVIPTHASLACYMFPFTPIELHEGWIVGKERILANRSGLFGWGDTSGFTWHVFDADGKPTDGKEVKRVVRDGKAYAEFRAPEGYCVAIVREQ